MPVITCPKCQAQYKVAESAAGRRAKCKKCGQSFVIPAPEQPAAPPETGLGRSDFEALAAGEAQAVPDPVVATPNAATGAARVGTPGGFGASAGPAAAGYAGYFNALGRTLTFPGQRDNLVTYLWVCLFLGIGTGAGFVFGMCFGWVIALIVAGWYMAFQFGVVLEAADGKDELPDLNYFSGLLTELLMPFLQMAAASIASLLPAIVAFIVVSVQQGRDALDVTGEALGLLTGRYGVILGLGSPESQILVGALLVVGVFLWPMFILVVAVGGLPGLVRLDLIGATILRSLPAYCIVVGVVYVSQALEYVSILMLAGLGGRVLLAGGRIPLLLLLPVAIVLVRVYVSVVAMRAIGRYYHHFKQRFAWSWG